MGLCTKCRDYFPPDFMTKVMVDNIIIDMCLFCEQSKSTLVGEDGANYTREFVVSDYAQFMRELKNNQNLKDKISELHVESAVRNMQNDV